MPEHMTDPAGGGNLQAAPTRDASPAAVAASAAPAAAIDPAGTAAESGDGDRKLVPIAESIRHRRRAQQAETQLQQAQQQLADLRKQSQSHSEQLAAAEAQRDEAQTQLTVLSNRSAAERILSRCGVADVEAGSDLLAKRLDLGQELDADAIQRGVEQLLLDKPFLRGPAPALPTTTAAARHDPVGRAALLAQTAQRAARTGDRRDVAEYLRLRRQAAAVTGR